jgi:hypothetical protein
VNVDARRPGGAASSAIKIRRSHHFQPLVKAIGWKAKRAALANLEALFAGGFEQTETSDKGQNEAETAA